MELSMKSLITTYKLMRTPSKYSFWLICVGGMLFIIGLFDLLDLYEQQNSYIIGLGKALLLLGVAYTGFILYQRSKEK